MTGGTTSLSVTGLELTLDVDSKTTEHDIAQAHADGAHAILVRIRDKSGRVLVELDHEANLANYDHDDAAEAIRLLAFAIIELHPTPTKDRE